MSNNVFMEINDTGKKTITINNLDVVAQYESVAKEYNALRHEAVIIEGVGYEIIKISGENAESFLNKYLTKDLIFMNSGSIIECMIMNEASEVLAFAFVCKFDNYFYLLIQPERQKSIFEVFSNTVEEKVNIELLENESLFFIEGPKSWKLVRDIFNVEVEAVALRTFIETSINSKAITVARIGRTGEYGYALLADVQICKELVESCLHNSLEINCCFCGFTALYLAMLEIHQPNLLLENSKSWNIFELGYQWFIQYDKKDYIGYEMLFNNYTKGQQWKAVGFICQHTFPFMSGEKIYLYNECVGQVLYSLYNPDRHCVIGISMLNEKVAVSGIELIVNVKEEHLIRTISSPFVRPLSWDEKIEY